MALELLAGGLELALEKVDGAEVDGVVVRCRVEPLGRLERAESVVVALLGDRDAGPVEPALAQRRIERERLVEVLLAVVELARDAVGRRAQEQGPGVLRLALQERSEKRQRPVAVAGVDGLLGRGQRIAIDRRRGRRGGSQGGSHKSDEHPRSEGSAACHGGNLSDSAARGPVWSVSHGVLALRRRAPVPMGALGPATRRYRVKQVPWRAPSQSPLE